jgi:hypothetical protein
MKKSKRRTVLAMAAAVAAGLLGLVVANTAQSSSGGSAEFSQSVAACTDGETYRQAIAADDERLWDERRFAQEEGYGITPAYDSDVDPVGTSMTEAQEREVIACRAEVMKSTPEGQLQQAYAQFAEHLAAQSAPGEASSDGVDLRETELLKIDRVEESVVAWSSCMARVGYEFTIPQDARDYVEGRIAALGELPPLLLVRGDGPQTDTDLEIEAQWRALEPQLDAIRQQEISIAVADTDCRRSTITPAVIEVVAEVKD